MFNKIKFLFFLWVKENSTEKILKPEVINLNANDICNSKCTMCNIWKQKSKFEIGYQELREIFQDPFYEEVKHVGITGGEPTLREDLIDLYRACIDFLPKLKAVSIITNGIQEKKIIQQITNINTLCTKRNIQFSVMVSLDGYGKTHDIIRGREGNFETAISVLEYSKSLQIPTSFGATISKENVWHVDELLDFAKRNNFYGRFRVAEFINRLYNNDRTQVIRNFDEDEKYHLLLFFEKLKRTYEKSEEIKRTYSSIQNILMGGERLTGCPYQTKALNLNSEAGLAFCAPKSKIIGNSLKEKSFDLIKENLSEKRRILKNECGQCIHDYHAGISFKEQWTKELDLFQKRFLKTHTGQKILNLSTFFLRPKLTRKAYSILIVGWYGTETVGDKAILAGIINKYKEKYGSLLDIYIGSLYPFITRKTIKELRIEAKVVNTQSFEFLRYSKFCHEVIMGGGPLMDLDELYVPLLSFKVAKKYNKKRVVYGCGIGPLTEEKFIAATKEILSLSSNIKLRDLKSLAFLKNYNIKDAEVIGDPAEDYIKILNENLLVEKSNTLSLFLRDWTYEYAKGKINQNEFESYKRSFERGLAHFIKKQIIEYNFDTIEFHHMHNFVVGNDDRDFSRRFIKEYFSDYENVIMEKKLSTVNSIVEKMKASRLNICMRFHSVLFAHTLNVEYIPIDYTLGGKIQSFLEQKNSASKIITVDDLIKNCEDEFTHS